MTPTQDLLRTVACAELSVIDELSELVAAQPDVVRFHDALQLRLHTASRSVTPDAAGDHRPADLRHTNVAVAPDDLIELVIRHRSANLLEVLCQRQLDPDTIDQLVNDLSVGVSSCATLAERQLHLTGSQCRALAHRDHPPTNTSLLARSDTPAELKIELLKGRTLNPRARKIKRVFVGLHELNSRGVPLDGALLVQAAPESASAAVIAGAIEAISVEPDLVEPDLVGRPQQHVVQLIARLLDTFDSTFLPGEMDPNAAWLMTYAVRQAAEAFERAGDDGPLTAFVEAIPSGSSSKIFDHVRQLQALLALLTNTPSADKSAVAASAADVAAWREHQLRDAFPHGPVDLYARRGSDVRLVAAAARLGMLKPDRCARADIAEIVRVANTYPHLLSDRAWKRLADAVPIADLRGISGPLVVAFRDAGVRYQVDTARPGAFTSIGKFGSEELLAAADVLEPAAAVLQLAAAREQAAALLTERLGCDRSKWATLFSLIDDFEGTFTELLDCCEQLAPAANSR